MAGGGSSGGSSGGSQTQVQTTQPWAPVQPYLIDAYRQLADMRAAGSNPYERAAEQAFHNQVGNLQNVGNQAVNNVLTGSQNAQGAATAGAGYVNQGIGGMGALAGQTAGGATGANAALQQLLGYGAGGATQQGTQGAFDAMNTLQAAGDPANNQYFQSALQSAIRPVTEQFREQVLPGIQSAGNSVGQFGGSRQGIAEGLASRGYMDTIGDISANMGNQAYAQGLQATQAAGGLGQALANMGLTSSAQAGQLGQGLAGLSGQLQSGIAGAGNQLFGTGMNSLGQMTALAPTAQDAALGLANGYASFGQLPMQNIAQYLGLLNQGAGMGGTSTMNSSANTGASGSRLTGALGGAASGAAIGSAFMPGIGTGIGALAGGLYGAFA